MLKILLLIGIGLVVWGLVRGFQRSLKTPSRHADRKAAETMVKCAHCGVNLPRSEAIFSQDAFYCTPEHQKLGKP
ncbi:MAG: PP0621 family protein [Gammaproteobacteria bacterium]